VGEVEDIDSPPSDSAWAPVMAALFGHQAAAKEGEERQANGRTEVENMTVAGRKKSAGANDMARRHHAR
jgi:hypothetical protein